MHNSRELYVYQGQGVELSENDWRQGFAVELEKQRPKGEPNEEVRNIDWWHFTAYANHLSSLDKQKTQELLNVSDKEEVIKDFRKLYSSSNDDKWWNLPIYAARLKKLGWYDKAFSDGDWEEFRNEIKERRDKKEIWHLAFYISQLSSLDQSLAKGLMRDNDWVAAPEALGKIAATNNENSALLALGMENNLSNINPVKGRHFLNPEHIDAVLKRGSELKHEGNWWLAAQYLEAGITARG